MESTFWRIARIILGIFMIYAGVQHFLKPEFYLPFVPAFLPGEMVIIYFSGIIEVLLGVAVLFKKFAKYGSLGLLILMIVFLPVHVYDVFSATPAIGSHTAALIRLPFQFIFIAWAWKIYHNFTLQQ